MDINGWCIPLSCYYNMCLFILPLDGLAESIERRFPMCKIGSLVPG